jgi:type IV pilus assembly protein PilX
MSTTLLLAVRRQPHRQRLAQRGAALWTVVALSLLLGMLALAQTSGVMSQFKAARNERDMAIARQAAEAALRDAEAEVTCQVWQGGVLTPSLFTEKPALGSHCDSLTPSCQSLMPLVDRPGIRVLGKSPAVTPAAIDWSLARGACSGSACAVELGEKTAASPLSEVARQPKYHVDVLDADLTGTPGAAVPLFRISARGFGATTGTVVDLQEVYRPCR